MIIQIKSTTHTIVTRRDGQTFQIHKVSGEPIGILKPKTYQVYHNSLPENAILATFNTKAEAYEYIRTY